MKKKEFVLAGISLVLAGSMISYALFRYEEIDYLLMSMGILSLCNGIEILRSPKYRIIDGSIQYEGIFGKGKEIQAGTFTVMHHQGTLSNYYYIQNNSKRNVLKIPLRELTKEDLEYLDKLIVQNTKQDL